MLAVFLVLRVQIRSHTTMIQPWRKHTLLFLREAFSGSCELILSCSFAYWPSDIADQITNNITLYSVCNHTSWNSKYFEGNTSALDITFPCCLFAGASSFWKISYFALSDFDPFSEIKSIKTASYYFILPHFQIKNLPNNNVNLHHAQIWDVC